MCVTLWHSQPVNIGTCSVFVNKSFPRASEPADWKRRFHTTFVFPCTDIKRKLGWITLHSRAHSPRYAMDWFKQTAGVHNINFDWLSWATMRRNVCISLLISFFLNCLFVCEFSVRCLSASVYVSSKCRGLVKHVEICESRIAFKGHLLSHEPTRRAGVVQVPAIRPCRAEVCMSKSN